jgi:uncharacterized lipoprotein YajG
MRQHRWFFLLLIAALLLPSCQTTDVVATVSDTQTLLQTKVDPLKVSVSAQHANIALELEVNECLNCHSDKERLIETAKEEELAESESSGVG